LIEPGPYWTSATQYLTCAETRRSVRFPATSLVAPDLFHGRTMPNLRIHYLFVEETNPLARHSIFHLQRESEMELLRCFMAYLQLPADADRIMPAGQPFFDAVLRYRNVGTFRKASSADLPHALEQDLLDIPLLCLMLGRTVPVWAKALAETHPMIVLSQIEATIEESRALPGMFSGLLHGTEDLRVFYAALRGLCAERAHDERMSSAHVTQACTSSCRSSASV
jgi:hypothetical protein